MDRLDVVVIGAGVVGLAIARAFALRGREVVILEAAGQFGTGVSSRNSEVIHAGLYYPPSSLKARLCLAGNAMLYEYCGARNIGHARLGKWVVAVDEAQADALCAIELNARRCGVSGLELVAGAEVRAQEPGLACTLALSSPASGIVDAHALMASLLADAQAHGATLVVRSPVTAGRSSTDGTVVEVGDGPGNAYAVAARAVINAAGLEAQRVARSFSGVPDASVPRAAFAKGTYFTLAGRAPFSRLVYPVPEPGGLGIHLTLDLAGRAKFGPDVAWVDAPDYHVDAALAPAFYRAIRRYWPDMPDGALEPGYAGVRPKLAEAGRGFGDFVLVTPQEHRVAGLWSLFGIDSPGLTASLALAEWVATQVQTDT